MSIVSMLHHAFLEGYATRELTVPIMFMCVILAACIGVYIFIVYKLVNRNSCYNRNFNLSLVAIAVITSAIILTIQSNIVVSLGMVGSLSIIRFRTPVKDPLDLVFLFWAISSGIICGAGFVMISVIASAVLTIIIVLFSVLPAEKGSLVLVVNAPSYKSFDRIMAIVDHQTSYSKIRARNVTDEYMSLAIEIKTRHPDDLIEEMMESESVTSVSLVEHDGNITA